AGAATYALGRHWRWPPAAALAAALAFELSGYLVSLNNVFSNRPPAALLPLVALLADRLLLRPAPRALAAAALAFGLPGACARADGTQVTPLYVVEHQG